MEDINQHYEGFKAGLLAAAQTSSVSDFLELCYNHNITLVSILPIAELVA